MTLLHRSERAAHRVEDHHGFEDDEPAARHVRWEHAVPFYGFGYQLEEEWLDQLNRLPSSADVRHLFSVLRVATLRELAADVVSSGVEHLKGSTERVTFAKTINSWIATAEETVAAGRNLSRIAARRKQGPLRP